MTRFDGVQAALQIANAASTNAYDDQYPSPYTVEAVRQGMDLPWWQKLLGARFKDGKFQLARLQVCAPLLFLPVLHAWGLYMRLIYAVCMECSNW